jgi:ribosomal protein S18 acetylase RimI-like enzyme
LGSDVESLATTVQFRRPTLADAVEIADVHCASWHSTYPGLIPQVVIDTFAMRESRLPNWQKNVRERADAMWVALLDGKVVGFAVSGAANVADEDCDGQLFALYLVQSAQRKGIGRTLALRSLADLHAAGFRSARVEVMSNNASAISFYEALGATFAREAKFEMMNHELTESVYVWRTLPVGALDVVI